MIQTDHDRTPQEMPETPGRPVACTLDVAGQATRRDEIAHLFEERQQVRELPDGYAVRFSNDDTVAGGLLRFISDERVCCPFVTFEVAFEPQQGPIWVRLCGPEGTKEVVAALLGL